MGKKKTAYYITQEAVGKAEELNQLLTDMDNEFGNWGGLDRHIDYSTLSKAVLDLVDNFNRNNVRHPYTEVTHEELENFGYTDEQISNLVDEDYLEIIEPEVSAFEELKEHWVNLGPEILDHDELETLLNAVREETLTNLTDNGEPLVAGDFRDHELYGLLGWVITNQEQLSKLYRLYQIFKNS